VWKRLVEIAFAGWSAGRGRKGGNAVARSIRFALAMVAAGLLLPGLSLHAQLQWGETSTTGSATLSTGYNATYGNMTGSTHGWNVGGAATFSGSFHSPNFLSYTIAPYLNQSRANSDFQSISNASGVNLSANIFGGSKFPGSINYAKAFNSEGNYAIPGLANYVTHGDSDTFGVNWSENLENVPSFSAGYQMGSSQYSVYGSNDSGSNAFHSVNLHSGYRWEGFNLGAFYTYGNSHSQVPEVVAGEFQNTRANTNLVGADVSHALPLKGDAGATFTRSSFDTELLGYSSTGTIDTVNASAAVHPMNRLSVSVTANYSDNLAGQLYEAVIGAGGVVPGLNTNESSDSFDLMGTVTYSLAANLQTSGFVERRSQTFLGETYGLTSYGGDAVYTHRLLNGTVNGSGSITANHADQNGQDTIGLSATESYSNVLAGWHLNESFSYAQNMQTLLITYTNSFYNYSANVRRNWGQFSFSAGAGGSQTALTQQSGTESSSQTYNGSIGYGPFLTATGAYSKADGQALATGSGLVGVPIPTPVLPPNLLYLFGGKSYSASLSSSPIKHLILEANYANSSYNTVSNLITSANSNNQFGTLVQYQVRKLTFVSGYARLEQGFSTSGLRPEIISSYYMGLSRWFNIF
jgi:hypothetical protein